MSNPPAGHAQRTVSHETTVLVVGAGPVGLLTSLQLAHHGVKHMLVERNLETTTWPKMDITNVRSMELLQRLGLADDLRKQGVPGQYSFDTLFSNGFGENGEVFAKWDLPSTDEWRTKIAENNDGSMPREPYQRCSQAIFEAWLKPILEKNQAVETHFGLKLNLLSETADGVRALLLDSQTGEQYSVRSKYVVGCDGAGSQVRKCSNLELTGGPVPAAMLLIHFKSRDLDRLNSLGQFWHIYFTNGACLISQDEVDTWTLHTPIPLNTEASQYDATETIHKALGGSTGVPFPIVVDQILVKSAWRPNLAIAKHYRTAGGRVFLAGDSAHQNIPTGGYGMNTGLGDAYDIGWKLAAVLNGWGGENLLDSYEAERRPVAVRNIERSGVHWSVHGRNGEEVRQRGFDVTPLHKGNGENVKEYIKQNITTNDGENKEHGIEMDYRFPDSPVVLGASDDVEHEWHLQYYNPNTRPGVRAPHVYLNDGKTSIFDLYGVEYTVVDFSPNGQKSTAFKTMADKLGIPLTQVHLPEEEHARKIWGQDLLIVRPDGYVAWRSKGDTVYQTEEMVDILLVVTGVRGSGRPSPTAQEANGVGSEVNFTSSAGNIDLNMTEKIALLAEFQK